uniref:Uncharacterized protein n=1 Tax=Oryza sativa subsp. japonica TaxID=39947 RepID=Q6K7I3_ORYSJ|nr:hypothetical protein [Oryza sativa Japonica Group]
MACIPCVRHKSSNKSRDDDGNDDDDGRLRRQRLDNINDEWIHRYRDNGNDAWIRRQPVLGARWIRRGFAQELQQECAAAASTGGGGVSGWGLSGCSGGFNRR